MQPTKHRTEAAIHAKAWRQVGEQFETIYAAKFGDGEKFNNPAGEAILSVIGALAIAMAEAYEAIDAYAEAAE